MTIGFYNLENLFDTEDDPNTIDEEFTPKGERQWTLDKYQDKLNKLARVISQLGRVEEGRPLGILGVCEIENRKVLEDLVRTDALSGQYLKIVHHDSKDPRGVDVALLYQPRLFTVLQSRSIGIPLVDSDGQSRKTRDILLVKGKTSNQNLYILVNHWPSRRGGQAQTQAYRYLAAQVNKALADSVLARDPGAGVIIMGDLNDNPDDKSLTDAIGAQSEPDAVKENGFYNPFYKHYRRGEGSTAYQDAWSLFDQILISGNLIKAELPRALQYESNRVFRRDFMIDAEGHFRHYPKRTFSGSAYQGGYSDHFPVLCHFQIR
ncbi:MAG TPA: endonuclease/exonuclease/phosphatase family protein [Saprospiraceae bacterium]|nr:endonuclease/exonuclease/phosphatase family protein [Saprospiraceae bacterium]